MEKKSAKTFVNYIRTFLFLIIAAVLEIGLLGQFNFELNNIYFYENCLENRKENNVEVKVFHDFLTYTPEYCDRCGVINEGTNDIINGLLIKIV